MMFQYIGIGGEMSECGTSTTGTCRATMGSKSDKKTDLDILATDYDNYSIIYTCKEQMGGMSHVSWLNISSREQTMSDEDLAKVHEVISEQLPEFDLSGWTMHNTRQGGKCEYDWDTWTNPKW